MPWVLSGCWISSNLTTPMASTNMRLGGLRFIMSSVPLVLLPIANIVTLFCAGKRLILLVLQKSLTVNQEKALFKIDTVTAQVWEYVAGQDNGEQTGAGLFNVQAAGGAGMPGAPRAYAGIERPRSPERTGCGRFGDSDHLRHRPWRHPDVGASDEGRCG